MSPLIASLESGEALSKRRLRLWIRLLRVTRSAQADLREFLRVDHDTTLPRFDVLAELHRLGQLTMSELSRALLVSNGNTTTVVDRLERDGLVSRTTSPTDRRIVRVELTEPGRHHFEALAADHERHLNTMFADVSAADIDAFEQLLKRITRKANDDDGPV